MAIKYAQKIDYVAEETPNKIRDNAHITLWTNELRSIKMFHPIVV